MEPFIYGIKPAVLAIIASAIIKLGKKAIKNTELIVIGALVLAASLLGVNEVIALLAAGILGMLYFYIKSKAKSSLNTVSPIVFLFGINNIITTTSTTKLFLIFLKVGAILYGSGYVLFAYLDAELVSRGLLTRAELIDAIAIGQFTPGPVSVSYTHLTLPTILLV